MFKKAIPILCTVLLVASITGCAGPTTVTNTQVNTNTVTATSTVTTSAASSNSLDGAGATFPNPLYSKWFLEYNTLKSVKVNYQAVGSSAGINAITNGTVNFGASDGLLSATQLKAAQDAYGLLLTIPMTSGSVALTYNIPGVASEQLKLSGEVLADIFLGTIKKWNDPAIIALNAGLGLPNTDIATVHRSDGSGTTNIFTNYLDKVSATWNTQVGTANSVNWPGGIGGQGNAGVAGAVQQTPNSIGYVELAYALENKLAYALLKNSAGNFIKPTIASTTAAANGVTIPDDMRVMITNSADPAAYPIVGFTWILVYANQTNEARGIALANMLWWVIHDGQAYCAALNYAPLSPAAVAKAELLVKSIKYQGQAIIK
jgi:phosphate transport system substrate-binding protein